LQGRHVAGVLSHLCCEAGLAGWLEAGARGGSGEGTALHKSTPFSQALPAVCLDVSHRLCCSEKPNGPASRHKPWMIYTHICICVYTYVCIHIYTSRHSYQSIYTCVCIHIYHGLLRKHGCNACNDHRYHAIMPMLAHGVTMCVLQQATL
jgi:hypothetical protein